MQIALTLFVINFHIFLMQIFFGLNVKHLRKARNIEREEFAEHFNLHLSSISHWERGKHLPKVEDVVRVAQFFGVSVDDILLKDLSSEVSIVGEKSEPYYSIGERNSQAIEMLQARVEALERWRMEMEGMDERLRALEERYKE